MSEMVERVAYAIAKAEQPNMGLSWCMNAPNRERCCVLARAAIEAMREPAEAMVEKGSETMDGDDNFYIGTRAAKEAWQAMINEAMK